MRNYFVSIICVVVFHFSLIIMDFPILVVLFLCLLNFPPNSFSSNGKEMASFMIRQKNGAFDTLEPTIIGLGSLTIFVQG